MGGHVAYYQTDFGFALCNVCCKLCNACTILWRTFKNVVTNTHVHVYSLLERFAVPRVSGAGGERISQQWQSSALTAAAAAAAAAVNGGALPGVSGSPL